jgi:hypothetical protein
MSIMIGFSRRRSYWQTVPPVEVARLSRGSVVVSGGIDNVTGRNGIIVRTLMLVTLTDTNVQLLRAVSGSESQPLGV